MTDLETEQAPAPQLKAQPAADAIRVLLVDDRRWPRSACGLGADLGRLAAAASWDGADGAQ
jgi:hypothetical protein